MHSEVYVVIYLKKMFMRTISIKMVTGTIFFFDHNILFAVPVIVVRIRTN
jgi:hypothetical protein